MFNVSMDLSMLCSHCDLRNQARVAVIMFPEVSWWDSPAVKSTAKTLVPFKTKSQRSLIFTRMNSSECESYLIHVRANTV